MLSLTLKKQYINDLVDWIEANLTDELNIDLISLKSGYSKWHMQRMFKEMTGQTLASYTRKRRLTMSAMALRLTRMPLIDIAVRFGFDNQQNFTRVFKNHFSLTPGAYRRIPELQLKDFHSRIPTQHRWVDVRLAEKPELRLCGEVIEWECRFGEYIHDHGDVVAQHARDFVAFAGQHVNKGWLGFQFSPGEGSADQQHISLFQALESQHGDVLPSNVVNWTGESGLYAEIDWQGAPEQINAFTADMYYIHLPALGVARREGKDLLRLDLQNSTPDLLTGTFFIPVTAG
ncbi:helix-turn-helix domain-containing protein [Pantoea sp. At-9b]|jgi:AraC family transcriptional regulator, mar-sox-rob regulon activator|uniref:helix-turn-helix domain-containing protein n=1 Tax=Pantoea sp. (strain At-9b) TaxID=592316 RepID=UPI0001B3DEF0|nr:helix-turn-helix domain-containing protein [Pantoea sp. At-9b]ADU70565.1 transcriptional regulator, AraC family [Pantoea sp. At-9b]